ncbi:MAG: proton-conducting transporter membrane subunit [Desulfurococcaceae archaeon]
MPSAEMLVLLATLLSVLLIAASARSRGPAPISIALASSALFAAISLTLRGPPGVIGLAASASSLTSCTFMLAAQDLVEIPRKGLVASSLVLLTAFSILAPLSISPEVDDLVRMLIYWEGLGFTIVGALGIRGTREEHEASAKYVLVTFVGALVAMIGAVMAVNEVGSTSVREVVLRASGASKAIMISGLLAEAAAFPMHFWLPDVHTTMFPPVAVALMGAATPAAAYVAGTLAFEAGAFVRPLVIALALATSLFSTLAAARQEDFKRLLAYSTSSHVGYALFAFSSGIPDYGSVHVLAHALSKVPIFLEAYFLAEVLGARRVEDVGALGEGPGALVLAASSLGLMGLPPFLTFYSELMIFSRAFLRGGGWTLAAATFFAIVVLSAAYALRPLMAYGASAAKGEAMPRRASAVLLATAIASVALALAWQPLVGYYF